MTEAPLNVLPAGQIHFPPVYKIEVAPTAPICIQFTVPTLFQQ
jgi:hypothetical protein